MAVVLMEGWDHFTGVQVGSKGWSQRGSSTAALDVGTGRLGSAASWDQNGRYITKALPGNYSTVICGFAMQAGGAGSQTGIMCFTDGGTIQAFLDYTPSTKLLRVFNGALVQQGAGVFLNMANGVFNYLEWKLTISNTVGITIVKLNGIEIINYTSLDTQNTGSAQVNGIRVGSNADVFTDNLFDDIYVLNTTDSGISGAPNNDFLGDVKVQTVYPNGNGNSSQFDGSDGNSTDNYLLVDETAQDGDTTYVQSGDIGDKDTYAFGNLSTAVGSVYAVQTSMYAKKTDAGTRSIRSVARLGTTEHEGTDKALATGYSYHSDIRDGDPDGNQWTVTNVNAAEFGPKVSA